MHKKITWVYRDDFMIIMVILLIAVAYWRISTLGFNVLDDYDYVVMNEHVRSGLTIDNIIWAFQPTIDVGNWHPITWLSHMLDVEIYGLKPIGHHVTNLIIHMVNSVLIFMLLKGLTNQSWPSAFVCFMFALHPLHIESVAWISERKDLLCATFSFLTIISFKSYVATKSNKYYLLTAFNYMIALMSKPMAVTLPFVLLLIDYWPLERINSGHHGIQRNIIKCISEKIPLFVMSIFVSIITFLVQKEGGAVSSLKEIGLIDRMANAAISYAMYLWKTVWPEKLSIFYPYQQNINDSLSVIALLFLVLVTAITLRCASERRYLIVGWLWYLGMLVPVIGLVQVGAQSMADRYTYLPLIGIFVMLAWSLDSALEKKKWKHYVKMPVILLTSAVLATITSHQLNYWEDGIKLMKRSVEISSGKNHYPHYLLGLAYLGEREIKKAEKELLVSLELAPKHIESYVKLAEINKKHGDCVKAKRLYESALSIAPYDYELLNGLAKIYQEEGRFDEAIRLHRKVISINPEKISARVDLAVAYFRNKEIKKAKSELRETLRKYPYNTNALNQLGIIEMKMGEMKEALKYFSKAMMIDPTNNDIKNNIGILFLITGSTDLALRIYQDVLLNDENNIEANYQSGVANMIMMKNEKAKQFLYKTVGLDEKHEKAHYALAIILYDEGKEAVSMRHLDIYMKIKKYDHNKRKKLISDIYNT